MQKLKKLNLFLTTTSASFSPPSLTARHIFYAIYSLQETVQIISIFEFPNWFWIYIVWKVLFGWDKVDIDRSLVLFLVFWFNYFLERELSIIWRQKIGFSEDPINSTPPLPSLSSQLLYFSIRFPCPLFLLYISHCIFGFWSHCIYRIVYLVSGPTVYIALYIWFRVPLYISHCIFGFGSHCIYRIVYLVSGPTVYIALYIWFWVPLFISHCIFVLFCSMYIDYDKNMYIDYDKKNI